ncbi:MAG TPA: Crp/Fnr family transcriptional regulator [Azospirillum sp.]
MDADVIGAVSRSPFFSMLSGEDRARLLGYSEARHFDLGSALFHSGDPARDFFVIASGSVGLSVGAGGRMDVLAAGDLAGEDAVFDRGTHGATARALLPVDAVAVPAGPFFAHMEDRFEVVLALLAGASAGLRGMIQEITELKLLSTARRLANFLVGLAGDREGAARLVLPCEKHVLAERLGMQPESLSRAFAKLRAQGVTVGRNDALLVRDVGALRGYAGSSDFDS